MSVLADRLRGIVGSTFGPSESLTRTPAPPADLGTAEILGGEWRDCGGHRFLVINRTYRPGHRHGRLTLADCVLPEDHRWQGVLLTKPYTTSAPVPGALRNRALFIDLETTGLAGGAGTYAFLVGCGWFDGCTFRVQQYLLSAYTAEAVLLGAIAELAACVRLVVSYNGKTFDLPLIETRFLLNRMETPFADIPHLDMLHPARRLWRSGDDGETASSCRLGVLEQSVCGHLRDGDVPGFEIPSRYFHYVRTGDVRPLEGVLEHNRLDLLSLAFLTARAAQLVEEGPAAVTTAREAIGLGHLYERAGDAMRARACFARATGLDGARPLSGDASICAEGLRAYALLCRRERAYRDAATAWQRLVDLGTSPPHVLREAIEALAVHHEHRLRDPGTARAFALRSLPLQASVVRKQALQHRLTRLDRKLDAARAHAPLF